MFFRFFIVLAVLAKFVAAGIPSAPSVSASVASQDIDYEGLNLRLEYPYKIQDAVVGFRYALGNFRTAPESLFARKSFDVADSNVQVDADFTVKDNVLNVAAKWVANKVGVTFTANADTRDRLKSVGLSKDFEVQGGSNLNLGGKYCLLNKKFSTTAALTSGTTKVDVDVDSVDRAPGFKITKDIDDNHSVSPSINLKTGKMAVGVTRKWNGGSVTGTFHPNDKVALQWKDNGAAGTWTTTADVPLDGSKPKVGFAHKWNV
jgi:hypothetical protein